MNKTLLYMGLALVLGLSACGSEDTPGVDFANPSGYFQPAADDQSATAALRRSFFAETGSYLLFNDTLQHVYQGTDINGNPRYFTETVDLSYNVGNSSTSTSTYSFTYITDLAQQQQVAQFVKDYVLPHVTGRMRPYSFFLCNRISVVTQAGAPLSLYAEANERCVGIAANYITATNRTEAQRKNYANRLLNTIVSRSAENNSAAFADFYAYSEASYGVTYSDAGIDGTAEDLRTLGFISSGGTLGSLPGKSTDLSAYVTTYLQSTPERLEAQYGAYDVVMAKFAVVARVLAELGYVA